MAKKKSSKKLSPFAQAHQDRLMLMFNQPVKKGRLRTDRSKRIFITAKQSNNEARETSVTEFASELKIPESKLIDQLTQAGILNKVGSDSLTEAERARLLHYLQRGYRDAKPLQPRSVYDQHPEHEELRRLIPNLKNPSEWMDGWRWGRLTASRRAELRCLVSDDFPELIRAYDWLRVLGSGYKRSTHLEAIGDRTTSPSEAVAAQHTSPFIEGVGEGIAVPKSPERLAWEEAIRIAEEAELQDEPVPHTDPDQPHIESALPKPKGDVKPRTSSVSTTQFQRDSAVKEWVLKAAQGVCECCMNPAPFRCSDGTPYLEVHHVHQLSEGGPDTTDNTVALCPNCHRELHYGANCEELVNRLYESVGRLVRG